MKREKGSIWGQRGIRKSFFIVVEVLLVIIVLLSGCKTGSYWMDSAKSRRFSEDLKQTAGIIATESRQPEQQEEIPGSVDFERLQEISEDAVAWLYAPDTPVDSVVAQADDNSYYLWRLLDGTQANSGTLFMDYRNHVDLSDWNTIIYGHNRKDGTMFASLLKYRDPEYYEAHPVMYLYTPGHCYRVELFAGYTTDVEDPIYSVPAKKEERDAIIAQAREKSTFSSDVSVGTDDRLVTFSTCAYDYENARYVVVGRIVEE